MEKFIALRPVQFDRSYKIGEEIPPGVIAPGSIKRLIDSGRIAPATSAQGAAITDTKAADALEDLVVFIEGQLDITYEDAESTTLTIFDRAEVCKAGLEAFIEAVEKMGIGEIQMDMVLDFDDQDPTEPLNLSSTDENGGEGNDTPLDGENPKNEPQNELQGGVDTTGETQGENAPGGFPCPQCDRVFDTQAGLNAHMRVHQ